MENIRLAFYTQIEYNLPMNNIKELRQKTKLSQSKFATKYGISLRTLQRWEQGQNTPPEYVMEMIENKIAEEERIKANDYISQYRVKDKSNSKKHIPDAFSNCLQLRLALSHFNCAQILRDNPSGDENQINIIGYLLQQSVELTIKYLLEQDGIEYPKTHDVDQLIRLAKENSVDLHLTEYISDHSEMFSQWESKSRYVLGYLIELEKIDKAIEGIDEYFKNVSKALNG